MKLLLSNMRIYSLLLLTLLASKVAHTQQLVSPSIPTQLPPAITLAAGNNTASCAINGINIPVSIPKEALTGDNIPLNIQLPGGFDDNCQKKITITASSELEFVTAEVIPFQPAGGNSFEMVSPLPGNESRNFSVHFKFPAFVTCNNTEGELTIKVEVDCNGSVTVCEQKIKVTARADNYWSVYQEYMGGDLTCGISRWRVIVRHDNPNPTGLGTYRIDGLLSVDPSLNIVSGGTHSVNIETWNSGQAYRSYEMMLRNCVPEGSSITNIVHVDLSLGGGCTSLQGTLTLASPPMVSPNADISFEKKLSYQSNGNNLTPGCDGRYVINVLNNGNVPWTNFVITDALPAGISLSPGFGAINVPQGWVATVSGNNITVTGTNVVLQPGQYAPIYIAFTIDPMATPGDIITNVATLSYQAATGGGGGNTGGGTPSTVCPGIACPEIAHSILNTVDTVSFTVEQPIAIPTIKKCIIDPPNTHNPPLYVAGDIIRFQVKIGNQGAGPLTTIFHDPLGGASNQNLQIIPGSITYAYYVGSNTSVTSNNQCNNDFGVAPQPNVPFAVTANIADLQNPSFTLTGMPGHCELGKMNVLVITFDALILPQQYGTKQNKAILQTAGENDKTSSVAYTIDEDGGLAVTKRADQEFVENGQTFNYIIDLINIGSVSLNNITVTDALPGCVQRAGDIVIKDVLGNTVPYTATGNIQLTLSPGVEIAPGATFTVTIPVQKVSGANCCNVSVQATGLMVTSGALQDAQFGSELEPAACVRSAECCDVPGFDAQLVQRDGRFYIQITGGAVPLQEVDVSMLDFHVAYSSADCKPANMGIFGQLSSSTGTLGQLVLGNGPMPAGSLSWGLGTPSIINNSVELEITNPAILDIPCCTFELTFCIKVRVKDVNCNVCEKTLCYTAESTDPPCDLSGLELHTVRFCPGQPIEFTWSGGSPSGGVDIYLVNSANPNVQHLIGTGISNGTNSYSFTLPADFPCGTDQVWHIVIKDPKSDCQIVGKRFTVVCCTPRCDCGGWLSRDIKITPVITANPGNVQYEKRETLLQKATNINVGLIARCAEKITLNRVSYVLTAPDYACSPQDCAVTYNWEVHHHNSNSHTSGTGKNYAYQFAQPGTYDILITPICGGVKCEPCRIQVHVRGLIAEPWPTDVLSSQGKEHF